MIWLADDGERPHDDSQAALAWCLFDKGRFLLSREAAAQKGENGGFF
jgi:hypothetical protein